MVMQDIEFKLRSMIKEKMEDLSKDIDGLNDFHLIVDIGYDSLQIISLIVDIEKEFNIEFDDDELDMDLVCQFSELLKMTKQQLQAK